MGHDGGRIWTPHEDKYLIENADKKSHEIVAGELHRSRKSVAMHYLSLVQKGKARNRQKIFAPVITMQNDMLLQPKHTSFLKPNLKKAIITCDYHAPFTDIDLTKRAIAFGKKFRISNLVIGGDFLDLLYWSTFGGVKDGDVNESRAFSIKILDMLLSQFDKIYMIIGNHEVRFLRVVNDKAGLENLLNMVAQEEQCKHIEISGYRYMVINDKWRVSHPKGKGATFINIGKQEMEKFKQNILVTHVHGMGRVYDRSLKLKAMGCGCMLDPERIRWYMMGDSGSPQWQSGFIMLIDDYCYEFPYYDTNWKFYLGKNV